MTKQIVQNEVRMQMRIRASVGTSTYDWIMDRRCWLVTRVRACTREPNVYQRRTGNITRHECAIMMVPVYRTPDGACASRAIFTSLISCAPSKMYRKDYGQPARAQAPDRTDRLKMRGWYNKNCVGPRRPPLPPEP